MRQYAAADGRDASGDGGDAQLGACHGFDHSPADRWLFNSNRTTDRGPFVSNNPADHGPFDIGRPADIAAPSTGVGIVGERPNNMASFSSVPLGSLVDRKVKAKIWAGQFVELDTLVGEFSESPVLIFDTQNRNPSVQMCENVSRRIFNVAQWTDAFLVYVAIYTECHPTDVASILKYVQLVRSMAASARNNMFIAYDRDFRKLRAHNNMPWDVIHQE